MILTLSSMDRRAAEGASFDLVVEVDDPLKAQYQNHLSNSLSQKELQGLDEKVGDSTDSNSI